MTGSAQRARQMMVGGLVLAHAVGVGIFGVALAVAGGSAAISVALGFAAVVIFFSIGQAIEVVACELDPVQGLGLALASYAVRVVGIGAGMWFLLGHPAVKPSIEPGWLMLAVTGTVVAWVGGVVLVASRQRVPIYDIEYVAPAERLPK
ncbi:hypothetical protein EAX62_12015 [Tessaracoccus antarcticus]|uniref:MFS transporter n=1 Tax=Tessaracoccus antarcticus TaxID=2479848 RepID=A0A3M0GB87_9ACTN|nr:hypothetical protein EAX62_12015 [Tessaracoccus antarcticus]